MPEEDPRILELREKRANARLGGGKDRIARQHAKGKLSARERIDLLLDSGTFVELETFALQQQDPLGTGDTRYPGDGVVTGYGKVDGRMIYVYAQDFTVQGGSLGEMHGIKISRAMDLAVRAGVPIVGLIDSGGARIQEGVYSLRGYAEIFRRNAQYSGIIPQISVIMGPCAGGASYSPALTDFIIMVEKQSFMFLTGPEVIKTVIGEEIDQESLGGAAVHLSTSGLASLTAPSDQDAIAAVRNLLSYLPSNNVDSAPVLASQDDPARAEEALNRLVPLDPSLPYSMHEAIELIVDKGSFLELQSTYAPNAVVGFARMAGQSVGIVSQEPSSMAGILDINASDKICRFVRFCDAFNIPIITFVDCPGFIPGTAAEHSGIIRHGAKVLYAYAESTVPKVSVITRKAYGGAYIVMSSKPMGSDINLAWPSAEVAVMGPEGAANILFRKQIEQAEDPAAERAKVIDAFRKQFLNPYAAAGADVIDDVIEPKETRLRIITSLAALRDKYLPTLPRKHGNMPV